jgi:hypothetical protein
VTSRRRGDEDHQHEAVQQWLTEASQFSGAIREALPLLELDAPIATQLRDLRSELDAVLAQPAPETPIVRNLVKQTRTLLMEFSPSPISAFLADRAARLLDQEYGLLFG